MKLPSINNWESILMLTSSPNIPSKSKSFPDFSSTFTTVTFTVHSKIFKPSPDFLPLDYGFH